MMLFSTHLLSLNLTPTGWDLRTSQVPWEEVTCTSVEPHAAFALQ